MLETHFSLAEVNLLLQKPVRAKSAPWAQGIVREAAQWCGDRDPDGYLLLVDWNNRLSSVVGREELVT